MLEARNTRTVTIHGDVSLTGYNGEYVFERISESNTFYEQPLLKKWFLNDSATIYDIGANIGNHAVYFAKYSNNAQIFAFEPMPVNFVCLEKNIADNGLSEKIKAYSVAIGEKEETAVMGLLQENNFGTASVLKNEFASGEDAVAVNIVTIDSLNLPAPDFVKIDTEGFELNVLRGMRNTLSSTTKKIVIWTELDKETSEELYEFMNELGFGIVDFDLAQNGNVLWCNCDGMKISGGRVLFHLLEQAEIARQRYWAVYNVREARSKYEFEQQKCNDLTEQLKSMVSKFIYEQNKANDLIECLKSTVSKYEYEQNKANDLIERLKSSTSKYEFERNKANDLEKQVTKGQIQIEGYSKQINEIQKELDMFRNSKMIKFMRYWVWHLPTAAKRKIRRSINCVGRGVYVKLLPYPRARRVLSRLNSRLRVFKNTQEIVGAKPSSILRLAAKNDEHKSLKWHKKINVAMKVEELK